MADVSAGDLVQIRPGAIDVTNFVVAKAGWKYVDGDSRWMTVEKVVPNWSTGGKSGLPAKVTKVRCVYAGVVVWQVQPEDIIPQVIKASQPETIEKEPDPPVGLPQTKQETTTPSTTRYSEGDKQTAGTSESYYAIRERSSTWKSGVGISPASLSGYLGASLLTMTDHGTYLQDSMVPASDFKHLGTGEKWRDLTLDEKKVIGPQLKVNSEALAQMEFHTSVDNIHIGRRKLMINDISSVIQNAHGFPKKLKAGYDPFDTNTQDGEMRSAEYDYKINVADSRYPLTGPSMEEQLQKVRASFGLPVHGNNLIARAMKYYLYNRFKTADTNLAHNRTVTHVFFTRPDLNLLVKGGGGMQANQQVMNHTEAAMIWRRYPEIFKLLTDGRACSDPDNFNMLLSGQVRSFDIIDENLSTNESGHTWNDYSMVYGDAYSGRTAGEFSCTFDEVADFSIINMMKLWIMYIDNVARGAWSPSYNLSARGDGVNGSPTIDDSHVFKKTLDYAASVYVFKCDPTGENVLYWTKYYGVFPVNTGAGALSWDADSGIGSTPKLSLKFAYSYKKDFSPVSLIEFNDNAFVSSGTQVFEPTFDVSQNQSGRPYVGTPFIAMKLASPKITSGGVDYGQEMSKIRLLFKPSSAVASALTDRLVYRNDITNPSRVSQSIEKEIMRQPTQNGISVYL